MLEWMWPYALALAPLPLLVRWFAPPVKQGAGAIRVPFFRELARLATDGSGKTQGRGLMILLSALAWLMLVLAVARPTWVGESVTLPQDGRDLMLAIDISGSMREDDMLVGRSYVTRLDSVKKVVGEFVEQRIGDRIGLILFGEQGYLQTPLTFDRDTARTQLTEALPGFAGNSTAIGDAIGLSISTLRNRPSESRVLILLTDGANTSGTDPREAMKIAQEAGIRIHTVGVGAETKLERGIFGGVRETYPSRDLDEDLLREIATTTGGQYFRARDPESMARIYGEINKLEPVPEESTYRPIKSLFHWPLSGALAFGTLLVLARSRSGSMSA